MTGINIKNILIMKKFLSIIIACCFVISCFAQEHLSFKGIPITGSMTAFCKALSQKGFTKIGSENNIAIFKGDFTGRKATVGVGATDDGKNVHSVVVFFDESSEWRTLVNTYDYYKDIYTRKYGEPAACKEYNPSGQDSNISLMYELGQGTVTYEAAWSVTGGTIEISIEKSGYSNGMVVIKYRDAQNVEAKIQRDIDDI